MIKPKRVRINRISAKPCPHSTIVTAFDAGLNDGDEKDKTFTNTSLSTVDKSVRYSLAAAGFISGHPTLIKSKFIRTTTTIYHLFICVMLTANVFISMTIAWNKEEDKILYYLFLKLATLAFYTAMAFCGWASFINCQRKRGFIEYYKQLDKVEKALPLIQMRVRTRRIKKGCAFLAAIAWILAFANIGIRIQDYFTHQKHDPISGHYLRHRVPTQEMFRGLQIFCSTSSMVVLLYWMMSALQFLATSFVILTLFEDFNNKVQQEVTTSSNAVLKNISNYRLVHLELCTLISKANSHFSVILGTKIGTGVVVLLLTLYMMSVAVSNPIASDLLIVFVYWIGAETTALTIIITMAHKVYKEVRLDSYLDISCKRFTQEYEAR